MKKHSRNHEPPILWREAVGHVLRKARSRRGLRLVDVAERAGLSAQYLSELERGMKDPSSEMLAAAAGALGLAVEDVARMAADVMFGRRAAASGREAVLVLAPSVGQSAADVPGSARPGTSSEGFLLAA